METENIQDRGDTVWSGGQVRFASDDLSPNGEKQIDEAVQSDGSAQSDGARQAEEMASSDGTPQANGTIELPETDPLSLKVQELQRNFSYDGFQMVRREAFAHLRDPAVTIRRDSVTFNTACISGLEDAVYVHLMINADKKMMAVRACDENAKDALRWCIAKPDKRKSRKITGKIFSAMVYSLMDWTENCRYKILGYKIEHDGEYIYVFDLNETEIFNERPKRKGRGAAGVDAAITDPVTGGTAEGEPSDKEKPSADPPAAENAVEEKTEAAEIDTRTPSYPEAWRDTFGLSVGEHKKALDIGIIDGFTVFGNG